MVSVLGLHGSVLGLGPEPVEALAERAKEAGFGLLELPLLRPRDVAPERLRGLGERLGLGLFLSLPGLPPALDAVENPQDALDFLETLFPVCTEAGCSGLGGLLYDAPGRSPGRAATRKEIDGLSRFLERAAKAARGYRLKLGLAPSSRFETRLLNRAADAAWLIERVGAENLFIQLDTFSMNLEEEGWAEAFEAAIPFLGHVNLSESNRGVPGRGLLDWSAVFKALADTGASCPLVWRGTSLAELAAGSITRKPSGETVDDLLEAGAAFLREKAREAGMALRS